MHFLMVMMITHCLTISYSSETVVPRTGTASEQLIWLAEMRRLLLRPQSVEMLCTIGERGICDYGPGHLAMKSSIKICTLDKGGERVGGCCSGNVPTTGNIK